MRRRVGRKSTRRNFGAAIGAPAIFLTFNALQSGDDSHPLLPSSPMRLLRHFLALKEIGSRDSSHGLLIENHDCALVEPGAVQFFKLAELRHESRSHIRNLHHHEFSLAEG